VDTLAVYGGQVEGPGGIALEVVVAEGRGLPTDGDLRGFRDSYGAFLAAILTPDKKYRSGARRRGGGIRVTSHPRQRRVNGGTPRAAQKTWK